MDAIFNTLTTKKAPFTTNRFSLQNSPPKYFSDTGSFEKTLGIQK